MATYLLIHGAFTGGWAWKKVAAPLRAAGHIVHTPTLEGCAERAPKIRPGIKIDDHVEELVGYLFYHDLKDVVLAGTSISGLIAAMVADKAPERVGRLIFIDSLLPLPGEKLADILVPIPGATWDRTEFALGPSRKLVEGSMFDNLDSETRTWVVARFGLHPIGASPQKGPALDVFWSRKWEATVINGKRGSNPSEEHQRRTAEKLGAAYLEIDCGHYPQFTNPQELAEMLMRD